MCVYCKSFEIFLFVSSFDSSCFFFLFSFSRFVCSAIWFPFNQMNINLNKLNNWLGLVFSFSFLHRFYKLSIKNAFISHYFTQRMISLKDLIQRTNIFFSFLFKSKMFAWKFNVFFLTIISFLIQIKER